MSPTASPEGAISTSEPAGRPYASINFVTVHDGFCLLDLVSCNDKHNAANGEGGNDGTDNNMSWNCGGKTGMMFIANASV